MAQTHFNQPNVHIVVQNGQEHNSTYRRQCNGWLAKLQLELSHVPHLDDSRIFQMDQRISILIIVKCEKPSTYRILFVENLSLSLNLYVYLVVTFFIHEMI